MRLIFIHINLATRSILRKYLIAILPGRFDNPALCKLMDHATLTLISTRVWQPAR